MWHSWGHLAVLFYIFFRHKNTAFFSLAPLGAPETCSDGSASVGLASSFRGLFPLKLQVFINSRWVSSLRKRRKTQWGNKRQASFFLCFFFLQPRHFKCNKRPGEKKWSFVKHNLTRREMVKCLSVAMWQYKRAFWYISTIPRCWVSKQHAVWHWQRVLRQEQHFDWPLHFCL